MGYRGRGYLKNKDMEVDASGASHGQFIRTRRGDDEVTGSDHSDLIFTGRGDDTVEGGGGNDVMFGGRGTDTAIFSGSVLDYNVLSFGCSRWNFVQGVDGCDFLHSFEVLQFDDFTLDLRANNDPLVVLRDEGLETSQGEPLSFQVDFYDLDGASVELVSASVTGGGTLTTQNTGVTQVAQMGASGGTTVSFDPGSSYDSLGAGESTTETVTLVISDGQGGTTTVTYEVTIEGQNDAPVALAVSATTSEDSPIVVAADYSDIDANDTHSVTIDTTGTLGAVTNNGDGTFSYDPTAAFDSLAVGESAEDTFTYTVDDGNGGMATETVTITIQGQNDAPIAMAVSDTSDEDGPIITVAADVSDVDTSDTFTFSVDTTGTLGSVINNGDGTFDYDPNGAFESLALGETATDTFSYTVDDGNGGTATETVTISVEGQNDAPVALAVIGHVSEDGPAISVSADFSDVDASDTHTFSVDTTGTLGTVTNNGDGTFGYDPSGAFEHLGCDETATDTFTYTVNDGNGGTSTETVTITVQGANDAPVVSDAVVATLTEDSAVATLDLLANASDAEGDTLAIVGTEATSSDGRSLTITVDPASGSITLDPAQFSDLAAGEEATVTVTYDVVEADRGYADTAGGETLDNAGTFFIADDDTGSLIRVKRSASINTPDQAIAAAGVQNGTLLVIDGNSSGLGISPRVIIDGVASNVGIDGIDLGGYTGPISSDTAEVPARFLVVNGDLNNETIVVEIPRADADCGDVNHVFTLTGVSQGNGISYTTPQVGGIELLVSPDGVSASAEIAVQGVNDAPEAVAVTADADENGPAVTVSADVSDADTSDTHVFTVDTTGTRGTVTNNGDGTFDYDTNGAFESLAVGETATDTFTYTVDDGNGGTDTETVTITVTGENDAPVVTSTSQSGSARSTISFGDQLNASDLFALYNGTAGAASLTTVGGLDAVRVGPQTIGRVPHTTIELFGAGELSAGDAVTVDLSSQNVRTGGDQDTFIGLTDGVRYIALFTTDQPGALLVTDFIEGAGNLGDGYPVIPTVTDRTTASLSQRLDNFDVQFSLDGTSDQLVLLAGGAGTGNIITASTLGTIGNWLDPSLGLSLVLSNDGSNETFYYSSLAYDVEVSSRQASGQIVFDDADVSDTQTASVTQVSLSGNVGTLVAADVQSLLELVTTSSSSTSGGTIDWTFPAPDRAFDYLADGETLEIAYTVTIEDGNGGSTDEVVTISVEGTNDAPVAAAVAAATNEDGPAITITADVTDADTSDTHTFTVDTTGTLGTVTNNGDGTFTYLAAGAFDDLAVGETATDTFTYTADDGNGGIATETVTVTITGQNDAPVAEAVSATVAEDPAAFSSASIGAYTIPNFGRFYVYDFDTGTAVSIARDSGANNTYDQLAAQHLSDGNGIVMQANPNNVGWGFAALTYVDGVGEFVQASELDVIGGNGVVDRSNGDWIAFGDSNENIESIEFDVVGLDLGNGYSVDAQVAIGPFDYEVFTTDDLRVDGAQFSSAINGTSPSVTVAADVSDIDSDVFVFSVDDSGTIGSVINNGDGTFTYSADGMFEHLNTGESANDSFAYTVDDGAGGLDTETVTITITGSDDFLFA